MRMNLAPAQGIDAGIDGALGWPVTTLLICVAAALCSAALVRVMIAVGVLDQPGHRSSHMRPTPKGGGVGVMAATLFLTPPAVLAWHLGPLRPAGCVFCGAGLLALISWLDDLRQFRPHWKLLGQAASAGIVLFGLWPLSVGPSVAGTTGPVELGAIAASFGWLVFVTNAVNFIDGLNGLAGGSLALAALWIGATAPMGLQQLTGSVLASALVGFLPFNWPKARIFLGDVGSQSAGLLAASLGLLRWQQGGVAGASHAILVMPLLLSGILFDVAFTLCRRAIAGERLSQAHRGHLYQLAHRTGVAAPVIAMLHWAFVAIGGLFVMQISRGTISSGVALSLCLAIQLLWAGFIIRRARSIPIWNW